MNESKSFASLTPTLLARKGGARPAMRPQLGPLTQFTGPQFEDSAALQVEDLGFNDMGGEEGEPAPRHEAEIVPLNTAIHAAQTDGDVPEVLRQRASAAASVARLDRPRRSALSDGRRAAFTLRLDRDRHLQLRLACAVGNRSAQQIVTEALDRLLADMPEITDLADQVRKRG